MPPKISIRDVYQGMARHYLPVGCDVQQRMRGSAVVNVCILTLTINGIDEKVQLSGNLDTLLNTGGGEITSIWKGLKFAAQGMTREQFLDFLIN